MRSNPKLILSDDQKDHPDDDDSGTMRSPPVPSIASAAWANIAGRRCVVLHRHRYEGEEKPMNHLRHSDPAERNALMRLPYRNWRPTRLGQWGKAPAGAAVVGPVPD